MVGRRFRLVALGILSMVASPGMAQVRPLPTVAIDGRDMDRPGPAVVHVPTSFGAFGWFGQVGGELEGQVGTELDEGSFVGGGVQGRMGNAMGELLVMQVEGTLEGAFVAEGQGLAAGSEVSQRQVALRGWRELFRTESWFGLGRVEFGLRLNGASQVLRDGVGASVEQDALVPGAELVFENRMVVGGEWGIHTRTALVMGQGNGARERALDWRLMFNYPLFPATFQRTDVSFGIRYLKQELTFYSVQGNRSTRTDFGLGGPEVTVNVRF